MADNFRAAIDDKTDLIVANSFDSVDAITKLGKQFPDQKWAVVDTTVDNPNVRGLVFQEHEGTYLHRRDLRPARDGQLRAVSRSRT